VQWLCWRLKHLNLSSHSYTIGFGITTALNSFHSNFSSFKLRKLVYITWCAIIRIYKVASSCSARSDNNFPLTPERGAAITLNCLAKCQLPPKLRAFARHCGGTYLGPIVDVICEIEPHDCRISMLVIWLIWHLDFQNAFDVINTSYFSLTNPHWVRVVGYGPFSLCVIHKEGLCFSSGGINRLMMMMMILV
jgi:hypothetical protein